MGEVLNDASVSIIAMLGNPSLCLHVTCYDFSLSLYVQLL